MKRPVAYPPGMTMNGHHAEHHTSRLRTTTGISVDRRAYVVVRIAATQRPQSVTLLSSDLERSHRASRLAWEADDGIGVCLEIEPPRGMTLVKAVHRESDEVGAVLEVADDDAAFLPGLAPDGREAKRAPAALARRGPQEAAATEPVERSMNAPERVLEPRRREFRRSGCRCVHR
jgi:hypothetical protein